MLIKFCTKFSRANTFSLVFKCNEHVLCEGWRETHVPLEKNIFFLREKSTSKSDSKSDSKS